MMRPRISAIVFLAIACVASLFSLFPFIPFLTTPRIEDVDVELFDKHTRYLFFIHKSHIHDELRRILKVTARVRELIPQVPPHAIRITIPNRPGDGGIMEYYLWASLNTAFQTVPEDIRETLLANIRVLALDKGEDGIGSTTYTEGQFLGYLYCRCLQKTLGHPGPRVLLTTSGQRSASSSRDGFWYGAQACDEQVVQRIGDVEMCVLPDPDNDDGLVKSLFKSGYHALNSWVGNPRHIPFLDYHVGRIRYYARPTDEELQKELSRDIVQAIRYALKYHLVTERIVSYLLVGAVPMWHDAPDEERSYVARAHVRLEYGDEGIVCRYSDGQTLKMKKQARILFREAVTTLLFESREYRAASQWERQTLQQQLELLLAREERLLSFDTVNFSEQLAGNG